MTSEPTILFACPACQTPLVQKEPDRLACPADGAIYHRVEGIWHLLPPERAAHYHQFIKDYEAVRQAEGRGSTEKEYFNALPFLDRSGQYIEDWQVRSQSYKALIKRVLQPLENKQPKPLKIMDLGAGNGWLSNGLAARGHHVGAIDLLTNAWDGLGTHVHYDAAYVPIQAEFDHLPITSDQVDLLIFNGSFHYSTDYLTTLNEALRVIKPTGQLVIMDTPLYSHQASGIQMVREREAHFNRIHGFPSNALPHENFLTYPRLKTLAESLGLKWKFIRPFYGVRWGLRPYRARLRGHREPARFGLIVARGIR